MSDVEAPTGAGVIVTCDDCRVLHVEEGGVVCPDCRPLLCPLHGLAPSRAEKAEREREEMREDMDEARTARDYHFDHWKKAEAKLTAVEALVERWKGEPRAGKWCVCLDELESALEPVEGEGA